MEHVFERFTERARQVVVLAQEEARSLRHDYIGSEHLLLGLVREKEDIAAWVLESLGITEEKVRGELERIVEPREETATGRLPFTPGAKGTLEASLREALILGHNYIGVEHVLLGLVREQDGVAMRILGELGADTEAVRSEVVGKLTEAGARQPRAEGGRASGEGAADGEQGINAWLGELAPLLGDLAALETKLGRRPDAGDLLIALTSVPDGVVERTLAELEVTPERLSQAVEKTRAKPGPLESLERERDEVRRNKEEAIQYQEFHRAAALRDDERRLSTQINQLVEERRAEFREEARRRLGLG